MCKSQCTVTLLHGFTYKIPHLATACILIGIQYYVYVDYNMQPPQSNSVSCNMCIFIYVKLSANMRVLPRKIPLAQVAEDEYFQVRIRSILSSFNYVS